MTTILAATILAFFAVQNSSARLSSLLQPNSQQQQQQQTLTGTSIPTAARHNRKILQKAVRVNRQGERILGGNNNNNNDNGLSGSYSIQFDTCVALSTEPDSNEQFILSDSVLLDNAKKKQVVPQVSYVLFTACQTKYCDYYQKGDNLYMIDLATYMYALADFYTDRQDNYCAACLDSYNYCQ